MENHGKDNFEDGQYCWDRLGKPCETIVNHGKDNFEDGHYSWDGLGKPCETVGKITSRMDTTTGTGSGNMGNHRKPWER